MDAISTMSLAQDNTEKERFSSFKFGSGVPNRPQSLPNRLANSHNRRASSSSRSPTTLNFSFPRSAGPLGSGFPSLPPPSRSPSSSPIPLSTSPIPRVNSTSPRPVSTPASATTPGAPGSDLPPVTTGNKRHSHHRRQSSLSTRRESADVMGVAPTALVAPVEELNINLGDTDSIRRRALLALEGRSELGVFSAMELPSLGSPEVQAPAFSFPTSQTYPSTSFSSFGGGVSSLINKRDSFGKPMLPSVSSNRQLGALIEEEEEEDEESHNLEDEEADSSNDSTPIAVLTEEPSETELNTSLFALPMDPAVSITPVHAIAPVHRPRPLALDLRLGNLVAPTFGLPTPPAVSPSATPTTRPGLRPLALASAASTTQTTDVPLSRRLSLSALSSSSASTPSFAAFRRPSLGLYHDQAIEGPAPIQEEPEREKPKRPLSIAYKSGDTPPSTTVTLPTPAMTPVQTAPSIVRTHSPAVSEAASSTGASSVRPASLSLSEQHFLFKQHNALLARIEDLERALAAGRSGSSASASRPSSGLARRPLSMASSAGGSSNSNEDEESLVQGPDEEMLRLVADLKAERDDLRGDVDGWRARVADYERQVSALARRLESERRDAWVARERAGILDVEKNRLADENSRLETSLSEAEKEAEDEKQQWALEKSELEETVRRVQAELGIQRQAREIETKVLREMVDEEKIRADALQEELDALKGLATPVTGSAPAVSRRRGPTFYSMDSETTEVDIDESFEGTLPFKLGQIHGLSGLGAVQEEHEEELLQYDDESDYGDFPVGNNSEDDVEEEGDSLEAATETPVETPVDTHFKKNSISSWTFPKVSAPVPIRPIVPVDRFFDCLEDYESSPVGRDTERGKSLFCALLAQADEDEDEEIPCFIPNDVGVEVVSPLQTLVEEEEEEETIEEEDDADLNDFGGVEVEGGIRFEFTLPSSPVLSLPPSPPPPSIVISAPSTLPPAPKPIASPPATANYDSPRFGGFGFDYGAPSSESESEDDFPEEEEETVFAFPQARLDTFTTPPPKITIQTSQAPPLPALTGALRRASSPQSIPKPSMIPVASPKQRSAPTGTASGRTTPLSASASAPSFIPQPRSVSGPSSSPTSSPSAAKFASFKFGGRPASTAQPSAPRASAHQTSGTPLPLSTPRPAPKALVRAHRSSQCPCPLGQHDDPRAHCAAALSETSRSCTPIDMTTTTGPLRTATPTPLNLTLKTLNSPITTASTSTTPTSTSPSLWTLASSLAFGSRATTPTATKTPTSSTFSSFGFKPAPAPKVQVSREAQLARLRAEMAATTVAPATCACVRCIGPIVRL